jgi:hypothetical protein
MRNVKIKDVAVNLKEQLVVITHTDSFIPSFAFPISI